MELQEQLDHRNDDPDAPGQHQDRSRVADETQLRRCNRSQGEDPNPAGTVRMTLRQQRLGLFFVEADLDRPRLAAEHYASSSLLMVDIERCQACDMVVAIRFACEVLSGLDGVR